MFPTLFLPVYMAKKYLAQNQKQKVLIFGANPELVAPRWLPSIFQNKNHQMATFSLFSLPISNPELIYQALSKRYMSVRNRWNNAASDLWEDIINFALLTVVDGEEVSFGEALQRTGFDLSFESLIQCAFDENGKIKAFYRTLGSATIESLSDTSRISAQEHYQYITMDVLWLFQEHQSRLASPLLVELNRKTLSKFDAILMIKEPGEIDNLDWEKDARVLAVLAMQA